MFCKTRRKLFKTACSYFFDWCIWPVFTIMVYGNLKPRHLVRERVLDSGENRNRKKLILLSNKYYQISLPIRFSIFFGVSLILFSAHCLFFMEIKLQRTWYICCFYRCYGTLRARIWLALGRFYFYFKSTKCCSAGRNWTLAWNLATTLRLNKIVSHKNISVVDDIDIWYWPRKQSSWSRLILENPYRKTRSNFTTELYSSILELVCELRLTTAATGFKNLKIIIIEVSFLIWW